MKILIADDHAIVREGLKQLLNSQKDMEVVGEAENSWEAVEKAKSLRPDVTLLDIAMPGPEWSGGRSSDQSKLALPFYFNIHI